MVTRLLQNWEPSKSGNTPWKFNIASDNKPSQKESNLPTIIFQGRAVKLWGRIWKW